MKRISWDLDSYDLPDFVLYNKSDGETQGQKPISSTSRPGNETYFIGLIRNATQEIIEKLLCYHITDGKYIVISYNFSAYKLLQTIIDSKLFELEIAEYEPDTEIIKYKNQIKIPKINLDNE